ncbi:MAG: hypothetical protein K0M64_04450 [Rhizobium sp.]|nr:hypothetical protein [Rhizobium sp.]
MKAIPQSLLQIARSLGLVRGIRMVRVRTGHASAWAVALRILGRWWLAARGPLASPRVDAVTVRRTHGPMLFASTAEARGFLDELGL